MAEALAILILSGLAAAIPTGAYVGLLWWLDPYEKEPLPLLLGAFLWGAVPAIFLSLIAEFVAGVPVSALREATAEMVGLGVVAPFVEEAVKGSALLVLLVAFRSEFDDVLDGIVYGAMIGFGFAMTENVFYFLSAYAEGGLPAWGIVVVLRAAIFGLNHALFTSITGAGLGLARLQRARARQLAIVLVAFILAVTLHSIHNVFAQLNEVVCGAVLIGAVSDWIGVLAMLLVAWAAWRKEKGWIATELGDELPLGTLTELEYRAAQSAWQRLSLRWRVWRSLGWSAGARVAHFYQLLTKLAFKKSQARLTGADAATDAEITSIRKQVADLRSRGLSRA